MERRYEKEGCMERDAKGRVHRKKTGSYRTRLVRTVGTHLEHQSRDVERSSRVDGVVGDRSFEVVLDLNEAV